MLFWKIHFHEVCPQLNQESAKGGLKPVFPHGHFDILEWRLRHVVRGKGVFLDWPCI